MLKILVIYCLVMVEFLIELIAIFVVFPFLSLQIFFYNAKNYSFPGSTGSVGKSSLEVIEQNKKYVAKCLVASKNSNLINQQSKIHKQAKIYLENPKKKLTF
ncbi:MAG: hypothetical protein CM15mP13_2750 [Pseudomonadota bacterium]|nr:MAG: hypothetical protein CM15mP13_2750 [Pseudomonadota bacterium]